MSNAAITNNTKKTQRMEQVFALWKSKTKKGRTYLSGKTAEGTQLVGFFNTNKKNPNEPDARIYFQKDMKEEYCSLWSNVSNKGNKYLLGKVDGKRVIGFINDKPENKRPYVSIYYSENGLKAMEEEPKQVALEETENLPF